MLKRMISLFIAICFAGCLAGCPSSGGKDKGKKDSTKKKTEISKKEKEALTDKFIKAQNIDKDVEQMNEQIKMMLGREMQQMVFNEIRGSLSEEELNDTDNVNGILALLRGKTEDINERAGKIIDTKKIIKEIYVPLCSKSFSAEEMQEIIDFFETETGKKLLKKKPGIYKEAYEEMHKTITPQAENLAKEIGNAIMTEHKTGVAPEPKDLEPVDSEPKDDKASTDEAPKEPKEKKSDKGKKKKKK